MAYLVLDPFEAIYCMRGSESTVIGKYSFTSLMFKQTSADKLFIHRGCARIDIRFLGEKN